MYNNMKIIIGFFMLVFLASCYRGDDFFREASIELNPKNTKEWRTSTIFKSVQGCMDLGGTYNTCNCYIDYCRKKYYENQFLVIRERTLTLLSQKKSIFDDPEIKNLTEEIRQACS